MIKNLKTILLLLTIMTTMCIFVGCGDGKQDDPALFPEQEKWSADTAGTGNDEEQVKNEKQESDTKEEQKGMEQPQPENMQNQPAEGSLDKPADAGADRSTDNNTSKDEGTSELADTPTNNASDTFQDESSELSVYVESIGDNSIVGNKISIESIGGNNNVMVVGNGEDNKKLITIYFAENASYVYRIIRNGGADVDTSEGSFSHIAINMILDLTGYYKGGDFYADKVVISDVRTN